MKLLKAFEERFSGSSFPVRVVTTDDEVCVLKMRGTGNGARSLLSEFLVNRIAFFHGFPVAEVFPVNIPDGFPWNFGTDEFDDIVTRSFGVNLGIRLVSIDRELSAGEVRALPTTFLRQMTALDLFFCNYDRQERSPNVVRDRHGKTWLLDHGSCLFLDDSIPRSLPSHHLLKSRETELVDEKLLRRLIEPEPIDAALRDVPPDWLSEVGMSVSEARSRLIKTLS